MLDILLAGCIFAGVYQPFANLRQRRLPMSKSESPADVPWRLVRLRHAVQRLALPGEMQLASLPDFVCKADELILDFDQWREVALQWHAHEWSPEQRSSLARLDSLLDNLTESSASDDAVRSAPEWSRVRVQAQAFLAAFTWPAEAPPSYAHEYVSGMPPGGQA